MIIKRGIIGAAPLFLAMAAQMEEEQNTFSHIKHPKKKKRKKKIHPNHKPFEFGEQTIYALNKKNAIKKAKKLGLL